ncbi:MAG: YHS domain-containing (seleno)protein [Pseudomonadota bacterium]
MKTLLKSSLIATALAFGTLTTTTVFAADEVNLAAAKGQPAGLAVQGYDVISYRTNDKPVVGSADFSTEFEGATYRFANQANLDTFNTDPAHYAPAYGGFCAYGVSKGKKFEVDPTAYKVVDDVLYLNFNKSIQKKWAKKTDQYISKAETKWTDIRSVAIDDL